MAETFEERKAFVSYLVKLMKSFFQSWNRDTIETAACLKQILDLSGGKLKLEIDDLIANGIVDEANPRDGSAGFKQRTNFSNNRNGNNYRNNNNNNRNQQQRSNGNGGGQNNKNRFSNNNNNRRRPQ